MSHNFGGDIRAPEMRVISFLIADTGTYNQQYRRSYQTRLDGTGLNVLQERLGNAPKITPGLVAGVANQFLTPSAAPERPLEIVNGWDERRLRFILKTSTLDVTGVETVEIVLGYTDHYGVGLTSTIDPNMAFVINSVMRVRTSTRFTPVGNQSVSSVIESSHVLANNNWTGMMTPERDQNIRPEDVYMLMSRTHLPQTGSTFDARNALTNVPVKSQRSNNLAANYMASVLQNYKNAYMATPLGSGMQELLQEARGHAADHPISRDPFINALSNSTGRPATNYFTFRELQRMDPNVENVSVMNVRGASPHMVMHQTGQTSDWGASDLPTLAATILSQSVPSLMMDLALTWVVFQATNRNFGMDTGPQDRTMILISDIQGFAEGDYIREMETFKVRLFHEVLQDLSRNDDIDYMFEMRVDLLGETQIRVSINGHEVYDYVTPSFCDAITVPVITSSEERAITLAQDFETVVSQIYDHELNPSVSDGYRASGKF